MSRDWSRSRCHVTRMTGMRTNYKGKAEFKGILRDKGHPEFIRMTVTCSCFLGELEIIQRVRE